MTEEKKKAIELIERYYPYSDGYINYDINEKYQWENSKKISLFICDEVISACEFNMVESHNTDWWNRVKKEIELL